MKRSAGMPRISPKRRARLAAEGILNPLSTLVARRRATAKRPGDTGPSREVRQLLAARSGGVCEWPDCDQRAVDPQHRLNRKAGGRHGAAAERINSIEWLLHTCRAHHEYVTSPSGERRRHAMSMGWLLTERQDAAKVPVLTRHALSPVVLLADGGWLRVGEVL